MKPWKARKYFKGRPISTKMFKTQTDAWMFAEEQNMKRLSDDVMWKVEKTFIKNKHDSIGS